MLQITGSQRVGHNLVTEKQQSCSPHTKGIKQSEKGGTADLYEEGATLGCEGSEVPGEEDTGKETSGYQRQGVMCSSRINLHRLEKSALVSAQAWLPLLHTPKHFYNERIKTQLFPMAQLRHWENTGVRKAESGIRN